MTLSLPSDPSLRQLKVLAKDLLKAHQRGDAPCCPVLRKLPRFAGADDTAIFTAAVSLADVQFAIALDYGFESWAKLKEHVGAADRAALPDGRPGHVPARSRRWRKTFHTASATTRSSCLATSHPCAAQCCANWSSANPTRAMASCSKHTTKRSFRRNNPMAR